MKFTYQYSLYLSTSEKLTLNRWLRICRYWYNWQLGERFNWWEQNRCPINSCSWEVCHLPELKDRPNYYNLKKLLPVLKKDLVTVGWSGEELDYSEVYAPVLQDVCKRVESAFSRFLAGHKNGNRSGKPRFKSESRYRTLNFPTADGSWLKFCTVNGKWLYLQLPKIGLVRMRTHRPIPDGAKLKQLSITKKADGWYIQLMLGNEDFIIYTSWLS